MIEVQPSEKIPDPSHYNAEIAKLQGDIPMLGNIHQLDYAPDGIHPVMFGPYEWAERVHNLRR